MTLVSQYLPASLPENNNYQLQTDTFHYHMQTNVLSPLSIITPQWSIWPIYSNKINLILLLLLRFYIASRCRKDRSSEAALVSRKH